MYLPGTVPFRTFDKPDDKGSANPDPTMRKGPGSPKGENMPPLGGESISPADQRSPGDTQKQIKRDEKKA